MTSTWDKNGACIQCGYIPFELTETCKECSQNKIKTIEEGLSHHGIQYLFMNDIKGIPIIYEYDYEELDEYLREYKHFEFIISAFSGEKVYEPEEQLAVRIKEFIKFRTRHVPIDVIEDINEEEISYYIDKTPNTNNLKNPQIIDEDKSSYDEMFKSLEKHNERGDTESIHIVEDQIYRRFIKDVALKKFTNINTIFETAKKIKEIIIDPNDGAWDSCRWYA